jgi:hypothetical protein
MAAVAVDPAAWLREVPDPVQEEDIRKSPPVRFRGGHLSADSKIE